KETVRLRTRVIDEGHSVSVARTITITKLLNYKTAKYLRVGPQHLLGMLQRSIGELGPADHAGNLLGALGAADFADTGAGAVASPLLLDQVMMLGKGGNLRQVRDTENLAGARKRLQLLSHRFCGTAADSGVNLVEDQRPLRSSCFLSRTRLNRGFERQHNARHFAA